MKHLKAIAENFLLPVSCIFAGVYLALISASVSMVWVDAVMKGVQP